VTRKQLTDTELDALVVRSLSRLPAYAPSRAFAGKVMDRVQLPSPRPVTFYRRVRGWALQPRRAMALAGAYALTAVIALGVAVPWIFRHSPAIRFAFDWTVARGGALMRDLAIAVASFAVSSGLAGAFRSIPLSGPQMWALAFGATAVYAGCAIGLHYLLRAPRERHATANAQA
jgi:hypothetical protein